jgi:hypothetical protein
MNEQLLKVLKGAAIAAAGAALAYLSTTIPAISENFAVLGPAITAVAAVLINAARKALDSWMNS